MRILLLPILIFSFFGCTFEEASYFGLFDRTTPQNSLSKFALAEVTDSATIKKLGRKYPLVSAYRPLWFQSFFIMNPTERTIDKHQWKVLRRSLLGDSTANALEQFD